MFRRIRKLKSQINVLLLDMEKPFEDIEVYLRGIKLDEKSFTTIIHETDRRRIITDGNPEQNETNSSLYHDISNNNFQIIETFLIVIPRRSKLQRFTSYYDQSKIN